VQDAIDEDSAVERNREQGILVGIVEASEDLELGSTTAKIYQA
jgi:hypothetical protein